MTKVTREVPASPALRGTSTTPMMMMRNSLVEVNTVTCTCHAHVHVHVPACTFVYKLGTLAYV